MFGLASDEEGDVDSGCSSGSGTPLVVTGSSDTTAAYENHNRIQCENRPCQSFIHAFRP